MLQAHKIVSPQSNANLIIDAYRSNLCRDPDTEGRVYWTASNVSRDQVDAALQATDEWQRWQPLRGVYLDTVAKDPASTEFGGRTCTQVQRYLAAGTPLDQVQAELATTRAGQRVRAIRDMYLELLERDPLPAERQTVGQLAWNGLSLELIRARIIASPEYEERHPSG